MVDVHFHILFAYFTMLHTGIAQGLSGISWWLGEVANAPE